MWNLRRTHNEQKKKKPLMAMISSAYFKIYTKHFLTFRGGRREYDNERGAVNIPKGVTQVTVRRKAE